MLGGNKISFNAAQGMRVTNGGITFLQNSLVRIPVDQVNNQLNA
jgi:hypothetical protein